MPVVRKSGALAGALIGRPPWVLTTPLSLPLASVRIGSALRGVSGRRELSALRALGRSFSLPVLSFLSIMIILMTYN